MYDVVIIGAGPAGATAALYLARANYKVLCLYRAENDGALAWTSIIENYPGFESISGYELVKKFRNHASKFGAQFKKGWVNAIDLDGEIKRVATGEGDVYESRAVIIATGALERANKIPGEEKYLGKGVSYCATCDAAFFKGKPTVVVADSEASFEEAIFVSRFSSRVYVLIPTRNPKASEETVSHMREVKNIEVLFDAHPKEITGDEKPKKIIYRTQDGFKEIEADGFFLLSGGSKPSIGFLKGQVEFEGEYCVKVNKFFETSVSGVYAIGDVLCEHIKQAVVAAAEGCIAALACDRFLSGRKSLKIDWS